MNPNPVNEFLPPGAGHTTYLDDMDEDEFDMARFSAIRKEQKDELERLELHHHNKQLQIDNQVRGEIDRLFAHFQQGMQNLYTGLTQTINATVETQVKLRMEQERLREEHVGNKREVERRYHNEASKIVMSTSNAARHAQPVGQTKPQSFLRAPNSSLPAGTPSMPTPNSDQHMSPATVPATLSSPARRQVMAKPAAINPMPREYVGHDLQHREYVAPYPTPQEPVPTQRRPVPSERRHTEPRHAEPRQVEPQHSEPRPRPIEQHVEPRPIEQRHMEQRPVEQRHVAPRPVEHHHAEPRHVESRPTEHRPTPLEPRPAESRPVEHRPVEPTPSQPSPAEPRHIEHRHIEPRPLESRPVETRPENRAQPIAAYPIYEEPVAMESKHTMGHEVRSNSQAEGHSEASTLSPSRQETKRKAAESPDLTAGGLHSKRPRTREMMAEEVVGQSPLKRSPRARPSSQAALETRVERTIPFTEVYQNGKAQYKHKIFEYKTGSGNWYIVRCDEHGVHFGFNNPVHGAAKHVHSPQHNNLEKRHDLAIEICGHRVLDCNAELVELNNHEFERAVKEDKYTPFNSNLLTKEGRRRLTGGPPQEVRPDSSGASKQKPKPSPIKSVPDTMVPQECKFFQGFWRATKKWYMLIILPIRLEGDLREVGLREKLQETDLMSNIPKCYRVDRVSLQIKGWQPAYEDGGPKVARREYPVMFFDSYRKHSVGWLSAQKLRAVDLENPPDDIDKRGLSIAREWYAQQMMHRPSWDDLKKFGRGEPPSTTSSTSNPDQWPSLRSSHTDDRSPIRDKSSGPGHFGFGSSSEEGSDDDDDPMATDAGPIPEPEASNYVAGSGPDDSDVEMEDTREAVDQQDHVEDVIHPPRKSSPAPSSRPSSRRGPVAELKEAMPKDYNQGRPEVATTGPPTPLTADGGDQHEGLSAVLSDQEHLRKSAQAKAAAAVMEAASRSRASSEVPDNAGETRVRQAHPSRPPFADHSRSRSEDFARSHAEAPLSARGLSKLNEGRKPSDLHSILNTDHSIKQPESANESRGDPYKRFEAIKAQWQGLRSASAPVHEGSGTQSPFSPPPILSPPAAPNEASAQPSPSLSHIVSPQSQAATMVPPRSSSSTPVQVQESGRSTPKITIPDSNHQDKWHAVRNGSVGPPPGSQSQTARASFATMPSAGGSPNKPSHGETAAKRLPLPTAELGTPIPEKHETFDVSQFRDRARGTRWSREGPSTPFLRLKTDPMRGWAETAGGAPLTAGIEPSKVASIEVQAPGADRQKVQLTLKDGNEQVVMFETNSANGRSQSATLQGRRFVSWVKKFNGEVELRNGAVSGRSSLSVQADYQ